MAADLIGWEGGAWEARLTANSGGGIVRPALGGSEVAGCGSGWPRHCFSSHSTQKVRPRDTGKPQAWHFCRFLNTSGTAIDSVFCLACPALWARIAADQKSAFLGAEADPSCFGGGTALAAGLDGSAGAGTEFTARKPDSDFGSLSFRAFSFGALAATACLTAISTI